MTLLQILILRPGNLLVKNHESLSINNESQLKKTRRPKLKMLGPLCHQTDNLETDAKTLHYCLLELNYSPSSTYLTDKKDWNKYASLNNSHRNHTNRIFYQKTSNRSFVFCILQEEWGGGGGLSFVSLSLLITDEKQGPSSLALYLWFAQGCAGTLNGVITLPSKVNSTGNYFSLREYRFMIMIIFM